MNKRTRRTIGLIIIITLLFVSISNYTYLSNTAENFLKNQVSSFGYSAIGTSVFILELIPQPFLSSLIPFTIGVLFNLNYIYLILIVVSTSIIANYTAYFLGLKYGTSLAKFFITQNNYEKSIKWFDKYGKKSISFLALTPLPYFPIMGGVFKMTLKQFTIYAIIPRIFHFIIFLSLIILLT
jgi:membrane protein YqaA with SNARE-associated domain